MPEQLHLNADTIDRIAEMAHASVSIQTKGGTTHLIVPEQYKHVDITRAIENAQAAPNRKTGTTVLTSIDSFIQYVKDQSMTAFAYIYADPESRTLTAVFNDNKEADMPGWRDHKAIFKADLTREANTWINNSGKNMEQEEFAHFLEANVADIKEPSGETLLSVALTLQAKTEVNFSTSKRLDNGQTVLNYSEAINATAAAGAIEIPNKFTLGMRIFKNGGGYSINARLRYRLGHGKVKFWYELDRPENAIEDGFADYIKAAQEQSGYTILYGKA